MTRRGPPLSLTLDPALLHPFPFVPIVGRKVGSLIRRPQLPRRRQVHLRAGGLRRVFLAGRCHGHFRRNVYCSDWAPTVQQNHLCALHVDKTVRGE